MNKSTFNKNKLIEILAASWYSSNKTEQVVEVCGMTKTEIIDIHEKNLPVLGKLLEHENRKIRFRAILLLGLFEEKGAEYLQKIPPLFNEFNEKEQQEIIRAVKQTRTEKGLNTLVELLLQSNSYDVLFEAVFNISELLEKHPMQGIELLLKCQTKKDIWQFLKRYLQTALHKAEKPINHQKELLEKLQKPIIIGISQEAEKRNREMGQIKENIIKAIRQIDKLQQSENTKKSKQAKKLLEKVREKTKK